MIYELSMDSVVYEVVIFGALDCSGVSWICSGEELKTGSSVTMNRISIRAHLGYPRMIYGLVVPQPRSLRLRGNGSANNHGDGGPEEDPNSMAFTMRLGKAYPCAHIRTCTIF
jgi:hypothetical protein